MTRSIDPDHDDTCALVRSGMASDDASQHQPCDCRTVLTPTQEAAVRRWMADCPWHIIFVATKSGEEDIVSAVTSRHIPNRLAREGWTVRLVTSQK